MYNQRVNTLSPNGLKGLDTTRITNNVKTAHMNSINTLANSKYVNNSPSRQTKLDHAYQKARNLIDQLIGAAQEKRDMSRKGIKTVGDTNEFVLDCYKDQNFFLPKGHSVQTSPYRQMSEVDLSKDEMLKIIENQRLENQSLNKKCHALHQQNSRLKFSNVEPNPRYNLFEQLMMLKEENESLRNNAIKLLRYEGA